MPATSYAELQLQMEAIQLHWIEARKNEKVNVRQRGKASLHAVGFLVSLLKDALEGGRQKIWILSKQKKL